MMISSDGWTLSRYLKQTHSSSVQTRFGIGYVKIRLITVAVIFNLVVYNIRT